MGSEASEGSHGNARVAGTCGGAQCGRAKVVKETPLTESERVAGAHVAERALFVTSRRRKTPTGNTTRGKAKFGKRHGSHKREEENPLTRRRLRGTAAKPRKPPPPQCGRAKVVKETPLTESERVAGAHVAERALFVTKT